MLCPGATLLIDPTQLPQPQPEPRHLDPVGESAIQCATNPDPRQLWSLWYCKARWRWSVVALGVIFVNSINRAQTWRQHVLSCGAAVTQNDVLRRALVPKLAGLLT